MAGNSYSGAYNAKEKLIKSKDEQRDKLATDVDAWIAKHGEPPLVGSEANANSDGRHLGSVGRGRGNVSSIQAAIARDAAVAKDRGKL